MKRIRTIAAAGLVLALAACGGGGAAAAHHPAAPTTLAGAVASAEAAASACKSTGGTWDGTYCAAPPASAEPTVSAPPPQQTDPNGESCDSLDSQGYCPGDDPSPMAQWCAGQGYTDFQQVQTDLSQLSSDAGANDLASVESDGQTLFADAHTAGLELPPLSNAHKVDYGVWMGYLLVAGYKASNGDIAGAASAMEAASKYTSITTYVSNQCGG